MELTSFSLDSSDKSVQEILNRLCLLAKIQEGEKLDAHTLQLQSDSYWTRFVRTISTACGLDTQTRDATYSFVKTLTDDALCIIERCMQSTNELHNRMGQKVLEKLIESKKGIQMLHLTYSTDKKFIAKLETVVLILDTKIDNLTKLYIKNNVGTCGKR